MAIVNGDGWRFSEKCKDEDVVCGQASASFSSFPEILLEHENKNENEDEQKDICTVPHA